MSAEQLVPFIVFGTPPLLLMALTIYALWKRRPGALLAAVVGWLVGLFPREVLVDALIHASTKGSYHPGFTDAEFACYVDGVVKVSDFGWISYEVLLGVSLILFVVCARGFFGLTRIQAQFRKIAYGLTGLFVLREILILLYQALIWNPTGLQGSLLESYRRGVWNSVQAFLVTCPYVLVMVTVFFFAVRRGFREQ